MDGGGEVAQVENEFAAFVSSRLPALLAYARALTLGSGGGRDAEDLVQEALTRTGAAWWRVQRKDDPEGYVRRAILRLHINAGRRREDPVDRVPDSAELSTGEALVDAADVVDGLLRALPPRMRAVLVLRYVEGRDDQAIADLLDISTGTVRSQAHRALAHLRTHLQGANAPTKEPEHGRP